MDIEWITSGAADRDLAQMTALADAARAVDRPFMPVMTYDWFVTRLVHGWEGDPPATAIGRGADGRVTGLVQIFEPKHDNTHFALLELTVDPALRGRGIGRKLYAAAEERTRAIGRTLLVARAHEGTPGIGFCTAMGMDFAMTDVLRRQDVTAVDRSALDREFEEARRKAAGYDLVRLAGATPDDMLPAVARLMEAINDAPTDDLDYEDEVFSPERVRLHEATNAARNMRSYRLVACDRATGELAGHTVVTVRRDVPGHANQGDTSVVRAHRGHGLGMLLKTGMLRWLSEVEPQIRQLDTTNAASNDAMIAINERLGYRVLSRESSFQKRLAP